jgi:hypothetical protein
MTTSASTKPTPDKPALSPPPDLAETLQEGSDRPSEASSESSARNEYRPSMRRSSVVDGRSLLPEFDGCPVEMLEGVQGVYTGVLALGQCAGHADANHELAGAKDTDGGTGVVNTGEAGCAELVEVFMAPILVLTAQASPVLMRGAETAKRDDLQGGVVLIESSRGVEHELGCPPKLPARGVGLFATRADGVPQQRLLLTPEFGQFRQHVKTRRIRGSRSDQHQFWPSPSAREKIRHDRKRCALELHYLGLVTAKS